jgi:hypothetical protein
LKGILRDVQPESTDDLVVGVAGSANAAGFACPAAKGAFEYIADVTNPNSSGR